MRSLSPLEKTRAFGMTPLKMFRKKINLEIGY
jgi:hypothetical protein